MMPSPFWEEDTRAYEQFLEETGTDPNDDNVEILFDKWMIEQRNRAAEDIVYQRGDDL